MGIFAPVAAPIEEKRDWLTDDDWMWEGPRTASGVRVTRESAMRLSTVWGCVRLLSNTIATAPTDVIVRIGPARFPEFEKPSWLSNPYPADPSMTWTEHIAQVATSLLLDGNFFTFVPNSVFDPSVLMVLDPRKVEIKRHSSMVPYYVIRNDQGQVIAEVDVMHMLHGTWLRMPGSMRGISPIDAARQGIGAGLATEDFAARFFGQGTALSFGVEVPGHLDEEQKDKLRESMKKNYASSKNSHSVGVLTDGAKFVTGLGITNEQAQFLEARRFTVEDIAGRIFGIPPHKMGSQEPGASSYNSVEIRNLDYRQDAVLPLSRRIEDPYNRLVEVPSGVNAPGASAQFMFNLDGIARADLKTRYEAYGIGIEKGFLKPRDAREKEDLPPADGDDKLYMQAQMGPLGERAVVVTRPVRPALPAGGA